VTELHAQPHAPTFTIRHVAGAELPFVLSSWTDSHMRSPGQPWGDLYRKLSQPTIKELLNREDTWVLAAIGPYEARPDAVLGWLAWTPGELPAIHYAYVRGALRKRGIFNALLKEAMVGRRMLATFRGQLPRYRKRKTLTYDKKVIEAMERRGLAVAHVPIDQWLERMRGR
jgi:hypothetical protein